MVPSTTLGNRLFMKKHEVRGALAVLILYGLLSVALTWPLLPHLNTHVLGPEKADNYSYIWKLWWVPHAIFDLGQTPFSQPDIYYPFGYPLAYDETTPLHTFFAMTLTRTFGVVAAYNLIMLCSTALSGWFTYFLARRWLLPIAGEAGHLLSVCCFTAGCSFAFSQYQMVRFAEHLNLIATHWVVLAFYLLDCWLAERRLHQAILLGTSVGLAALASWYYAFILAAVLALYSLFRAENLRRVLLEKRTWIALGAAAAIVLAFCVPFLMPYVQLARQGDTVVPTYSSEFWSASPVDYLVPNPQHPLWGRFAQAVIWPFGGRAPGEFMSASIGWVTLLFGVMGWRQACGRNWRALKGVAVFAFVLSLGPVLNFSRLPTGIPLPVALLSQIIPGAASLRSWGRFSLFVLLAFSLLAGAGLAVWAQRRAAHSRTALAAAVCAVLLFSLWIGPAPLVPVEPRPVDRWLAEQPGRFAIMQYPIDVALSGPSMLYTRYHGKPIVYGFGTYLPFFYRERHPALLTFPADEALDQLAAWQVKYVLVATEELGREPYTLDDVARQPRLRHVITLEGEAVYELLR
jgi:hypothetical protein